MNADSFPYKRIENIGVLNYLLTILIGKNNSVRWIDMTIGNEQQSIEGDFAATVGKKAFILTGYSEAQKRRIPLIVTRWKKERKERNKEIERVLFKSTEALDNFEEYTDSSNYYWEYSKPIYKSTLGGAFGLLTMYDPKGYDLLKIHLE